ncbi:MAG: molybdopterin molybdotransferase MoeA [Phycisphaerales bacterium]
MTEPMIRIIAEALDALLARIRPVVAESIEWSDAPGRALAQPIVLDRPSPACDVSAMDGYALSFTESHERPLRVVAESMPGSPAPPMPDDPDAVVRIFTGAMVPAGARAVIQRERVNESATTIRLHDDGALSEGMNIRRCAENANAGQTIATPGEIVTPGVLASIAGCGIARVRTHRPLSVGVLVTGDEVLPVEAIPEPWQLRDGNGPAVRAMLQPVPWIGRIIARNSKDERSALREAAAELLEQSDALILTGGVSAGDHDHVPEVLGELGVVRIFHKLMIRPGKPVFGGVDASGRPVLGLPGNPVSVMTTARLLALPSLAARVGIVRRAHPPLVHARGSKAAPAHLWWYPLVRIDSPGEATLVPSRGSGDWVAAASADGFIEVPPGEPATGLRPFYAW